MLFSEQVEFLVIEKTKSDNEYVLPTDQMFKPVRTIDHRERSTIVSIRLTFPQDDVIGVTGHDELQIGFVLIMTHWERDPDEQRKSDVETIYRALGRDHRICLT